MIWYAKIITKDGWKIFIEGDSESYKQEVIKEYWDKAEHIEFSNYIEEVQYIK